MSPRLHANPWFMFFAIAAVLSLGVLIFNVARSSGDVTGLSLPGCACARRAPLPAVVRQALAGGDDAAYRIALAYVRNKKYDEAFPILLKLAEKGHTGAQTRLAGLYENGRGVRKDPVQGLVWLRLAAEKGDLTAQNNLGMTLEKADSEEEKAEGLNWLRRAAEQGDLTAQNNLGVTFCSSGASDEEYAEGLDWLRRAAEQGDSGAMGNLGLQLRSGREKYRNTAEAFKWFLKATESGEYIRNLSVADMYYKGEGVKQNYAEAFRLYKRMAEDIGWPGPQYMVGMMYLEGKGVQRNPAEGKEWIQKAADQGYKDAVSKLKSL